MIKYYNFSFDFFYKNILVLLALSFGIDLSLFAQVNTNLVKLTSTKRQENENFGWKCKIYDKYCFVATPQTNIKIKDKILQEVGSVTIFKHQNNQWKFHQKIFNDNFNAFDFFGGDIDISGNYLAIGADGDEDTLEVSASVRNGSVSIYKLNTKGIWEFNQKLKLNPNQRNFHYGKNLSLKNNIIAINAINEPYNLINSSGSVYIYIRDSTNRWGQVQKITPPEKNLKRFGKVIAMNDSFLIITADLLDKIFIYKLQKNNLFKYLTIIEGQSTIYEKFGSSLLLLNNKLFICAEGDYNHNDGLPDNDKTVICNREKKLLGSGAVYVYDIVNDSYIFKQKLVAKDNKADLHFGNAISGNDSLIIIGAFGDKFQNKAIKDNEYVGATYLFKFKNNTWEQIHKIVSPKRATWDKFGFSVDIYNKTFIIGSRFDKEDEYEENPIHAAGSVYIGAFND